jgi:hypothetical protein
MAFFDIGTDGIGAANLLRHEFEAKRLLLDELHVLNYQIKEFARLPVRTEFLE